MEGMRRTLTTLTICAALIGGLGQLAGSANPAAASIEGGIGNLKQEEIRALIASSELHYQRAQQAYADGEYDMARREFDMAVDAILSGAIDIRSDDQLRVYYRELIEKINRYQIAALEQRDGGFSEQRYEPSPLDKIASLSDADLQEVTADDQEVTAGSFNFQFAITQPVRQFIAYFTRGRGRSTMEAGLRRSVRFRAMAERVFKEEGVPTDLIWLAQVESGWNPYALSHANAKGIWQFIPSTGWRFGLAQNYWVDERSDPEKSTRAAARYLKWLANRYGGNWTLTLAAYNTGERNIDAAIGRSRSRDFWQLHQAGLLAQETRNYVPAILAVVAIAKNANKYGFELPPAYHYRYETRLVSGQTSLRPLASKLRVSYGTLVDLNPELQRGVTPPGRHLVRIPAEPKP
jgi:membrane-bound lytic murein transglycosylase D